MKALLYILRRTIINYLKSFKKKPQKAIGPVFMILFIFLMLIPKSKGTSTPEPSMDVVFVLGFTLLTVILLLYSIHKGTKKLKSYFLMSDVNLIFPSPIRPQTVLLYGLVKQVAMELLISFWFLYQIPNILRSFNVPPKNQIMLIGAVILFQMVFCNCLKLMIFACCARFKGLANLIRWAVKLSAVLLVAIPGTLVYLNRHSWESIKNTALGIYNSKAVSYIPVVGWMKELAYQSVGKMDSSAIVYFILFISLSAVLVYITYGIELDYYEDVLSMAEENEFAHKVKSGDVKQGDIQYNRNGKAVKIFINPLRRVRLKLDGVYGAKTFLYKHVNEYFKRGIWFINFYSLFITAISIIYALTPVKEIKFLLFVFGGFLVYSSLANKVQSEINYHYIYMIPDESENKLFYSSMSSLIKVAVDGLLLFVPSGIIMHTSIIEIILCIIIYISFGVLCSFSGLFVYKIGSKIGLMGSPVLFSLFLLFFQTLMLIPNIVIVSIITFIFKELGRYAIYFGMLSFNIGAAVVFIYSSRSILSDMEQNSLY
jgi:hypothetical protein